MADHDPVTVAAALITVMGSNPIDQKKLAALLNVTPDAVGNYIYKKWRPRAQKLITDAVTAGRLNHDGNVVGGKLAKPKYSRGGGGAKAGKLDFKVEKGEGGKGKGRKRALSDDEGERAGEGGEGGRKGKKIKSEEE